MNLFIDTNVYLSFYHFTSNDLDELKKLILLMDRGKVKLFVPLQIIHEYKRNREGKISSAIKMFKEQKLNNQFPQFCKDFEEFSILRTLISDYNKTKSILLDKLNSDISSKNLKADIIIQELFEKAEKIDPTEELIKYAKQRFDLGNPPGKNNSYGDALAWESLLGNIDNDKTFCLISDDKDYKSPINENSLNSFLQEEWIDRKNSDIEFFIRLSSFFMKHFPQINLADEEVKNTLIDELFLSPTFAESRRILHEMKNYTYFTDSQLDNIVAAVITNNQIFWILEDSDIFNIVYKIIEGKEDVIDKENYNELAGMLNSLIDDEVPF
jgi:hypothetical protein